MVLSFDQRQRLFERFQRGVENKITNFFLSLSLLLFFSYSFFFANNDAVFPFDVGDFEGGKTLTTATSFEARVPKTFTRPDYSSVLFFSFSFSFFLFQFSFILYFLSLLSELFNHRLKEGCDSIFMRIIWQQWAEEPLFIILLLCSTFLLWTDCYRLRTLLSELRWLIHFVFNKYQLKASLLASTIISD